MGSDTPKQFLTVNDKPIIVRTIERFLSYSEKIHLFVVIPQDQESIWTLIKNEYLPDRKIISVIGGQTRFESVRNGLEMVKEGLVAIHDAVRPYVSVETISESFRSAGEKGSGVAVVSLKDSIREVTANGSRGRDRNDFRLVQTPQTFRVKEIKAAFAGVSGNDFQDDATVYENAGFSVSLVEGSYDNIKITTPEDLR